MDAKIEYINTLHKIDMLKHEIEILKREISELNYKINKDDPKFYESHIGYYAMMNEWTK